jgi:hypothetical protein
MMMMMYVQLVVEIGEGGNDVVIPMKPIVKNPESYVNRDVNISEEMSKTGIWHHLNSQSRFQTSQSSNNDTEMKHR